MLCRVEINQSMQYWGRFVPGLLILLMIAFAHSSWGFESNHETVTLLWNDNSLDCEPAEMDLIGDYLWSTTVLLPGPETVGPDPLVYFKYMVDGSLVPLHYGQDLARQNGVVFASDPPAMVVQLDGFGYFTFQLGEAEQTYTVGGAPGSIRAEIVYAGLPIPPPDDLLEATHVWVENMDTFENLGTFHYDLTENQLLIWNLVPEYSYMLTYQAPGYLPTVVEVFLPDTEPLLLQVTLKELVPVDTASWGEIKALYR